MPALNTSRTAKHDVVRARIDRDTKARATKTLTELGLTPSDAIRMLMTHIAKEGALPFEVHVPNTVTAAALAESDAPDKLPQSESIDDFFQELAADG